MAETMEETRKTMSFEFLGAADYPATIGRLDQYFEAEGLDYEITGQETNNGNFTIVFPDVDEDFINRWSKNILIWADENGLSLFEQDSNKQIDSFSLKSQELRRQLEIIYKNFSNHELDADGLRKVIADIGSGLDHDIDFDEDSDELKLTLFGFDKPHMLEIAKACVNASTYSGNSKLTGNASTDTNQTLTFEMLS